MKSINLNEESTKFIQAICDMYGTRADEIVNEIVRTVTMSSVATLKMIANQAAKEKDDFNAFDCTGPKFAKSLVNNGLTYEQALFSYMAEWRDGLEMLNEEYGKDTGEPNEYL